MTKAEIKSQLRDSYSEGQIRKEKMIYAAFMTPTSKTFGEQFWGLPVYWEGGVGEGKTTLAYIMAQIFNQHDSKEFPFFAMSPASLGEGFFGVIPTPSIDPKLGPVIDFPLPRSFIQKFACGYGFLFVDEMKNTPGYIQSATLGLIQEHRLGSHQFPGRVRVMAAGNPTEISTDGHLFAAPQSNRLIQLKWPESTIEELEAAWYKVETKPVRLNLEAEEKRILMECESLRPKAKTEVLKFLAVRPKLIRTMPADPSDADKPFASPRSWEMVTWCLMAAKLHDLNRKELHALVAGCVGPDAALEFLTFREHLDLPDPREVLTSNAPYDGKEAIRRLDRTAAVIDSCVQYVLTTEARRPKKEAQDLVFTLLTKFDEVLFEKNGSPRNADMASRLLYARVDKDWSAIRHWTINTFGNDMIRLTKDPRTRCILDLDKTVT